MGWKKIVLAVAIGAALVLLGLLGGLNGTPGEPAGTAANPPATSETGDTTGETGSTGGHTGSTPPSTGVNGGDPSDPTPSQTDSGVLRPAFGTCPGAPPTDGGMQRRPDTAKGPDGRLHKVWSERFSGQWDVCYAVSPGEMGLGSSSNPAWRITSTVYNSTEPHVSVDPVSGLAYVVWVESMPDVGDDGVYEALHDGTSLFYSVTENGTFWSNPISLSAVPDTLKTFEVDRSNGTVKFGDGAQGKRPPSGKGVSTEYRFSFDTDRDGILDSEELLGILGNITYWWNDDTDDDGLKDGLEYTYGFSPLINDIRGADAKRFYQVMYWLSDGDLDGLSWKLETDCIFPVTNRFANVQDTGSVSYRFWPRTSHNATLTLLLQVRRQGTLFIPPPTMANYSLAVTVYAPGVGTFSFDHAGYELEWDRVYATFGDFTVQADFPVDVTIEVSVEQPPPPDHRLLGIYSVMTAGMSGSSEFSYKEGGDFETSNMASALVENYNACGDPIRPDLFLEVDAMSGHNPTADVFSEVIDIYSDAGIILHYRIDETSISHSEATTTDSDGDGAATLNYCTDSHELTDFLGAHRNTVSPYDKYVHVIFVHDVKAETSYGCYWLYGVAMSAELASDYTHGGVLIADAQLETMITTATVIEQRTKILAHEVGHALGASHETYNGLCDACVDGSTLYDTDNPYNLMKQDGISISSDVNKRIHGHDNYERCKGAVEFIGAPRFSIESINQLNLKYKLSVDTGRIIDVLYNFV